MKIDLLITDCTLLSRPATEATVAPGFVAIADGEIIAAGPMEQCPPTDTGTILDGQGQLALPGLINGHCHAPMTLFRGMADDLPLATWLHAHIFPAEARCVNAAMVYLCAKLAAAEMLLAGITAVADGYFFEEEVARACVEVGLRCVAAQGVIDYPAPGAADPSENIAVARRFLEQWQGRHPLIKPAVFAHSPYTCSPHTLIRAKELSRQYQTSLFLHVAETSNEIEQIRAPLGPTPIRHLDALGILDRDTVCVHCVWVDAEDLDILARRESGVVICPQSHLKLASGRAPLRSMLARNIRVGLGTDGAASNNSLDLFREMDIAAKIQKVLPSDPVAVPARQILDLAIRSGAEVIGLHPATGVLAPGSPADLILLDTGRPHLQPLYSSDLLVYSGCSAAVRSVIVNGRLVVHERELLTIDLAETMAQVSCLAAESG
jgi:5-methylthioadenosine/S-adenosylhomocysteine deaminase